MAHRQAITMEDCQIGTTLTESGKDESRVRIAEPVAANYDEPRRRIAT